MRFTRLARWTALFAVVLGFASCTNILDLNGNAHDVALDASGGSGVPVCSSSQKVCNVNGRLTCVGLDRPEYSCDQSFASEGYACSPCYVPNATAICSNTGKCALRACNPGFLSCDPTTLGCQTDPRTTLNHCGACNVDCNLVNWPKVTKVVCNNGLCDVGDCIPGWGNCDSNPYNGCETFVGTPTMPSPLCGRCGGCPSGMTCDLPSLMCVAPPDGGTGG